MLKWSHPAWPRALRTARVLALVVPVALLLIATPVVARAEPAPDVEVYRDNTREVFSGAATLAGAGCPTGPGPALVLGVLVQGEQLHLWKLAESNKALDLSPALLRRVKDSTDVRVDDSAFEPEAYCEAVLKSSLVSLDAFANSAYQDVHYSDLHNDPVKWRGKVVHYEGDVRRIRRFDAPLMLEGKGIKDLYECWLFRKDDGTNPVCLVCTELPPDVQPGEKLNLAASFDAYFFKKYRYQAVDSKPGMSRTAPLFIGRSFVLSRQPVAPAATTDDVGPNVMLMAFLGIVLATLILAVSLHWWFRHNDRRVQARVREARMRGLGDAGTPNQPGPTPSAN